MKKVFLCFYIPENYMTASEVKPSIIVEGEIVKYGNYNTNTCLIGTNEIKLSSLYDCNVGKKFGMLKNSAININFHFFTKDQREEHLEFVRQLAGLSEWAVKDIMRLHPMILLIPDKNRLSIYHFLTAGHRGTLYINFYEKVLGTDVPVSYLQLIDALAEIREILPTLRRSINDRCWYSKWKADYEMERKYTFLESVDTWKLSLLLKRKIESGFFHDFILEFKDEFQVWDFDNYMYEMIVNGGTDGYISFIPLADGKFAIKKKNFKADCEMRKENINSGQDISFEDMPGLAQSLTTSNIVQLSPYRRKRFDINLESLRTGNVFGIFFDICRPLGQNEHALYQCEVEYLRSRTFQEIRNVEEEYEEVNTFAKHFLESQRVQYSEGYLSKLTYLRAYCQNQSRDKERSNE